MNEPLIVQDLHFIIFSEIYQKFTVPKARRKFILILEAAISCYEKSGFDSITFKMIARESGLTTSSLRHYFRNLEEIQEFTIKYVYFNAQKVILETIGDHNDPLLMLIQYLEGHFIWAKRYRKHLQLWNSFTLYGSKSVSEINLNTQAVTSSHKRLATILRNGRLKGIFFHSDDSQMSQIIHTVISGWLVTITYEKREDVEAFSK